MTALKENVDNDCRQYTQKIRELEKQLETFKQRTDISEKKAAEKKIKNLLNEYDTIFNNTLDAIFLIGVENETIFRFLRLNRAHEKLTGFLSQAVKGKTPEELIGTETGRALSKNYLACVRKKTAIDYEETLDLPGGKKIWHTKLTPVLENGVVCQIIGVARDITKEKLLAKERDIFFDVSLDMTCIATFDGYFKQINPMWEKTLGWTEKELKSRPYMEFVHPDDIKNTLAASRHLEKGQKVMSFENRYLKKDGSYHWLSWKSYPDMETGLIFAIARDMQKRKEMEEKLLFLSQTDPMLNIFNRGKLLSVLGVEIQKFNRYQSPFSIVMFDIDHFKSINDSFGHAAGDSVLKQLTGLVQSLIRDIDVFARWGGEEFIILLPHTDRSGAGNTAERIRSATEKTDFGLNRKITVSFGAAAFTEADDADNVLKRVDDLLYLAKKNGRNRVELETIQ